MGLFSREQMPSIKREMDRLDEDEARRLKVDWNKSSEELADDYIAYIQRLHGEAGWACRDEQGNIFCVTGEEAPSRSDIKLSYPFRSDEARRLLAEKWDSLKENRSTVDRSKNPEKA